VRGELDNQSGHFVLLDDTNNANLSDSQLFVHSRLHGGKLPVLAYGDEVFEPVFKVEELEDMISQDF
jgi:hypothetical protein